MSFLRAARAARRLTGQRTTPRLVLASGLVLAGISVSLSCGSSTHVGSSPSHQAYVTLPSQGSVLLLKIDGATGEITVGARTPQVQNTTPNGLALAPSKKFLYVANSFANSISTFKVASDGTLTLGSAPMSAGSSPDAAVIDPSGKYLLVTNNFGNNVSVYALDAGSGALTEVAGSPYAANSDPSEIVFAPSGKFVYVSNPSVGAVTGFAFANGVLSAVPNSPFSAGDGAFGLAVDNTGSYLYVANPTADNPLLNTKGNISGFTIDANTGSLTTMPNSPFTSNVGSNPTALAVDPTGRFLYALTPGASYSIWCFAITPASGQLVAASNSPFSLNAGGLFAFFDPSGGYLYTGNPSGSIAGYTYNPSTGAPTVISGSPFSTSVQPGKMVLSE